MLIFDGNALDHAAAVRISDQHHVARTLHITIISVHKDNVSGIECGLHGCRRSANLHGNKIAAESDGRVVAVGKKPALHCVLWNVSETCPHLANHRCRDVVLRLWRIYAFADRGNAGIHEADVTIWFFAW